MKSRYAIAFLLFLLCGAALLLVNADPAVVVGALMLVLVIAAFILGRFLGMPAPNGARRD